MFPDNQPTEPEVIEYFLPEWVTEIFYGGQWEKIEKGSLKQGLETDDGPMAAYVDPFSNLMVFITEPITGWKIEQPVPEEPKATVTPLRPKR